jgi:hypothetical protein
VSEFLKLKPERKVLDWLEAQRFGEPYITAITEAEFLFGFEILPIGKRRSEFESAFEEILEADFQGRILPFESASARAFATILAASRRKGKTMSQSDAMIAAIAKVHSAKLATRNTKDFVHSGIEVVNPWTD